MPATDPQISDETPLSFNEVATRTKVNHSTVRRWVRFGVVIRGARVKLKAERVGGHYRTSAEALARFVAECNAGPVPTAVVDRTPAQVQRDSERAAKELAAIRARAHGRPKPKTGATART